MSATRQRERTSDGELLAAAAQLRVDAVRDGLGEGPVRWGLGVAVVVADLDVETFIAGVAGFALALPDDAREGWYRSFTRTVFLAGHPATVAARHPYRQATDDARCAWYGPARRGALQPLSRLLRAFHGPVPMEVADGPLTVHVPGTPSGRVLDMAVAVGGVSTGEYLVHVHHLVAEAALRGLLRPGDEFRVEHRQTLGAAEFRDDLAPARADHVQTRIVPSRTEPERLRLYGLLTPNRREGTH